MSADTQEKAPGVYVRDDEHEQPHELDMLWSNPRSYHRDDRSPIIAFIAGLLIGIVLTSAVFLLLVMRPNVQTSVEPPIIPLPERANQNATVGSDHSTRPSAVSPASKIAIPGATTYTVRSGDTLGSISQKVYGSIEPMYLDKIQRANNLANPNNLHLDQTLIIPPKEY